MLTEWLAREGWIIFNWWLLATLAGAAVFPLMLRFMGGLPDRGYSLARPAGMLIVAFTFWLMAMFGFVENTTGSMILAWLIVLVISLIVFLTRRSEEPFDWRGWWRENRTAIIAAELVFAAALIGWSVYRAYQNGILYTEKDMELAFISSVMRSETFPPNDPWMAGYAISYYYFGYVIAGMMSMLSGINSTTGFNMMNAMTFALTALGVFGVVYNLVRSRAFRHRIDTTAKKKPGHGVAISTGLLGVLIVLLMGNWHTLLLEIPWQIGTADQALLDFFNLDGRQAPAGFVASGIDDWDSNARGWWWFRSARVLNDIRLDGAREEVIDEFPAFSFILSDNHPHVMGLPYTLLAIGLALNTLLLDRVLRRGQVIFYAVALGGLIFLNTWDGPIYMLGVIAADALRRYIKGGAVPLKVGDWLSLAWLGIRIVGLSLLFYLPFLIGFRSQLGGVLPNVQFPTMFSQFFMHFAPLLIIIAMFLGIEYWRAGRRFNVPAGLTIALVVLIGLIAAMLVLVIAASLIPSIQGLVLDFVEANGGWETVLPALLTKRLTHFLTALVLGVGLFFVAGRLFPRVFNRAQESESETPALITYPPATGFVLLLVGAGILLTLIPEFVYLRDNFTTRMNTVFKFYYQAWVVWGIASAYAMYTILSDHEQRVGIPPVRFAFGSLGALVITGGLLFTIFAVHSRTWAETNRNFDETTAPLLTLDGGESFIRAGLVSADDYAAVQCLSALVEGDDAVVVEAVGGSYRWGYGRVGTLTGIPILFNWTGHQGQWRGSTFAETAGSKEDDIYRLYTDPTWFVAREILLRYNIDYVFFGQNERIAYNADETMFRDNLEAVCDTGTARVYRVDLEALEAGEF